MNPPETLETDKTSLARGLWKLNLCNEPYHYLTQFKDFWLLAKETAIALRHD